MSPSSSTDFSALVSARLCHDLVSPLGAIGNGLELMQMTGPGRGEAELALVSDSLANALGKLRFLRVAFGPADADARYSLEEADQVTASAFQGRFSVAWIGPRGDMPRPFAKALYLALLCLEKSLPLGGEVRVQTQGGTAALNVEGRRTAAPPDLWAHALEGAPLAAVTSDSVQFTLLRACLDALGGRITAQFTASAARLDVTVPAPAPA